MSSGACGTHCSDTFSRVDSLQGSQEIGEGRVDGLEPEAETRGERPTRLDLRAFQYDSAHFAVEHLDRKRRRRGVLADPQRSTQRFREFAIGHRLRRDPFQDALRLRIKGVHEQSNDVVDVDPAHPLLAASKPARGGRAEQRQHLRQRAPLPREDDPRPHDRYAHIGSRIPAEDQALPPTHRPRRRESRRPSRCLRAASYRRGRRRSRWPNRARKP